MNGTGRWILAGAVAACLCAPHAARGQVPTLDRVDSLVTAGDYASARSTLERWFSARDEFDVPGSDMARALMLRGRLAPDPESAEPHYLALVLGYPTSAQAPDALLRLGQALLAAGDAGRAAAYLERLVSDYPGRAQHTPGLLWLARARTAAGRYAAACSAARAGIADARDPDLAAMLRVEAGAACGVRTDVAPAADAPRTDARADARTDAPSADGAFAAQTGAFRLRESADDLLARLRAGGFEPRLVRLPGSELLRVRLGRFADRAAAERLVARLEARGFDALIVTDADRERRP